MRHRHNPVSLRWSRQKGLQLKPWRALFHSDSVATARRKGEGCGETYIRTNIVYTQYHKLPYSRGFTTSKDSSSFSSSFFELSGPYTARLKVDTRGSWHFIGSMERTGARSIAAAERLSPDLDAKWIKYDDAELFRHGVRTSRHAARFT